jgi:hypothetical protein
MPIFRVHLPCRKPEICAKGNFRGVNRKDGSVSCLRLSIYANSGLCGVGIGAPKYIYIFPVLYGKIRRDRKKDKKAEKIFEGLNWRFISGSPFETSEGTLIISCQGYTFELVRSYQHLRDIELPAA